MNNKITPIEFKLKNGNSCTIREARTNDAQQLLDLAKSVIAEKEFQVTEPDEFTMTLDQEYEWINKLTSTPSSLLLLAEVNNNVIGILDFHSNTRRKRLAHTGEFGTSVAKEYRGQGVGSALIQELLNWAKDNSTLKKVSLSVFANNEPAISLYKKVGFTEEGRRIKQFKVSSTQYIDDILMYQEV